MESSSNEISDEIEMRFGHWVIRAGNQSINGIKEFGNWSLRLVIVNWLLPNGHWQLVISNQSFERVFESVEEC